MYKATLVILDIKTTHYTNGVVIGTTGGVTSGLLYSRFACSAAANTFHCLCTFLVQSLRQMLRYPFPEYSMYLPVYRIERHSCSRKTTLVPPGNVPGPFRASQVPNRPEYGIASPFRKCRIEGSAVGTGSLNPNIIAIPVLRR